MEVLRGSAVAPKRSPSNSIAAGRNPAPWPRHAPGPLPAAPHGAGQGPHGTSHKSKGDWWRLPWSSSAPRLPRGGNPWPPRVASAHGRSVRHRHPKGDKDMATTKSTKRHVSKAERQQARERAQERAQAALDRLGEGVREVYQSERWESRASARSTSPSAGSHGCGASPSSTTTASVTPS